MIRVATPMSERKKRSKADGPTGRGRKTAPVELATNGKKKKSATGENGKKKKKDVREIDGVLWLHDDAGNPIKKVIKKGDKPPPKPKKNIVEIDGQLYLLDENGKPSKKVRKKGDRPSVKRSSSNSRVVDERGRSIRRLSSANSKPRSKSLGAIGLRKMIGPQDYIDSKGRRIIIDEDGNKTVMTKDGKKLRPKKKPGDAPKSPKPKTQRALDIENDFGLFDKRESNIFDGLWDEGASVQPGMDALNSGNGISGGGGENHKESSQSLSAKISEYGKENRELSIKLSEAEEQIQDLTEQNKREKAKNVKATTEMMQLKADSTEAKGKLQKYKAEIKDLYATLEAKDKDLKSMKAKVKESDAAVKEAQKGPQHRGNGVDDGEARCPTCGNVNMEIEELYKEKQALQRKLEFERTNVVSDAKKKEDKIAFLAHENASLREEIEQLIRGEKGDITVNPTFVRAMNDKKKAEKELEQERNLTNIRFKGLKEEIEMLENENVELQKKLRMSGVGGDEVDFATGRRVANPLTEEFRSPLDGGGGGGGSRNLNNHVGEIQLGMGNNDKKNWWGLK